MSLFYQRDLVLSEEPIQLDERTTIQMTSPPTHYKGNGQRFPFEPPRSKMATISKGNRWGRAYKGENVAVARVTKDHWALLTRATIRGVPSVSFDLYDFGSPREDSCSWTNPSLHKDKGGNKKTRASSSFGTFKIPGPRANYLVLPGYWYQEKEGLKRTLRWGVLVDNTYIHLLENEDVQWSMRLDHAVDRAEIFEDGQVLIGKETHEWPCGTDHGEWTLMPQLERRLFTTIEEDFA